MFYHASVVFCVLSIHSNLRANYSRFCIANNEPDLDCENQINSQREVTTVGMFKSEGMANNGMYTKVHIPV